MKLISTLIAVTALPLIALGQTTDQQQGTQPGQTNEAHEKAPKKKARSAQQADRAQTRPENGANGAGVRAGTKNEGHAKGMMKSESAARAGKTQTTHTKVNKQEFRSQHNEVFTLGRHPKDFFVQRFGASHFRLIGNSYFVFVDGCWVAVDVDGFTFVERVICEGDPDFIVVY